MNDVSLKVRAFRPVVERLGPKTFVQGKTIHKSLRIFQERNLEVYFAPIGECLKKQNMARLRVLMVGLPDICGVALFRGIADKLRPFFKRVGQKHLGPRKKEPDYLRSNSHKKCFARANQRVLFSALPIFMSSSSIESLKNLRRHFVVQK